MSDEPRPYLKQRRAASEQETRRRITESTVELHGTVGPSRTTISAVAERAGVRRSTVYRHFPDEESLFAACTAHWNAANPLPDPEAWATIEDPTARLHDGLSELYGFYRRNAAMLANLVRDAPVVPLVAHSFGPFLEYLDRCASVLREGRGEGKLVPAAIGHALAFTTWQSLAQGQGLSDSQAIGLMTDLIASTRARRQQTRTR